MKPNQIARHEPPTRHVSRTLVAFDNSTGLTHVFGVYTGGRSALRWAISMNTVALVAFVYWSACAASASEETMLRTHDTNMCSAFLRATLTAPQESLPDYAMRESLGFYDLIKESKLKKILLLVNVEKRGTWEARSLWVYDVDTKVLHQWREPMETFIKENKIDTGVRSIESLCNIIKIRLYSQGRHRFQIGYSEVRNRIGIFTYNESQQTVEIKKTRANCGF